jgi:CRP-like cAMP-binding protein
MQTITFKAGDTIVREGDEGDTGFLITTGSVEVLIVEVGRRVGTLDAGEVFGELCLIDPGPRSATVRALTDVECLETSYEEFLKSIEERPGQALAFMKTLVQRLRQTNQLIEDGARYQSTSPSIDRRMAKRALGKRIYGP